MHQSFNKKVIWITGASSGIGEALAYELGSKGALLALSARGTEQLMRVADTIRAASGVANSYPVDVCDSMQLKAVAAKIRIELGEIDVVIANAGTHVFTKPEQFDSAEYLRLMDINFGGTLKTIEAALPAMIERKGGHIVGMASLAGYRGLPRAAAYGATKAALIHFLESIRFHLEKFAITVTIINPGFVKTPLTAKNDFPMPFLLDAQSAARIIVRGLERRRREISFPWPFHWILNVLRIIPYTLYRLLIIRLWKSIEPEPK